MAEVIRMPKMSDTMEEGVIAAWLKKEGDTVKAGDILAEVETDKATMELEAYEDGTLLYIGVKEQEAAPINGVIAIIGEQGEDIGVLLAEAQTPTPQQEEAAPQKEAATNLAATTPATTGPAATAQQSAVPSIIASPLAKKMAQEKGYELAQIQGTGEGGRIVKRDIENFTPNISIASNAPTITLPPVAGEERYEDVAVSGMRKTIAKRLAESKFSAPHFYLTVNIDMDQVVAARPSINEYAPVKISFNDIVIKAAATALRQHPTVNASWLTDKIRYNQHIHIGIAVALEDGLVVPVVRFADTKSLAHIAEEVKAFTQKAANKQLTPQDAGGDTFSISNLGMKGIESFTAIVNPPASCNLAVGAIKQVPVVKDGAVVPGHVMKATLSCDHRVVDGAVGAAFLQTFKTLLEDPLRMLTH
ncbi:MAG: dihydrolipoamide acetyltransferase family protein [Bacteroidota bacterium]